MSRASSGATSEPESRKRMMSVASASSTIATGRRAAIASRSSSKAAASPPTHNRREPAPPDRPRKARRDRLPLVVEGGRIPADEERLHALEGAQPAGRGLGRRVWGACAPRGGG